MVLLSSYRVAPWIRGSREREEAVNGIAGGCRERRLKFAGRWHDTSGFECCATSATKSSDASGVLHAPRLPKEIGLRSLKSLRLYYALVETPNQT